MIKKISSLGLALALCLVIMLIQIKQDWLDIGPSFAFLAGATLLGVTYSRRGVIRSLSSFPSMIGFKPWVVTIAFLFCSISTNVGVQLVQKKLIAHFPKDVNSLDSYQRQFGKSDAFLGKELDEKTSVALTQAKRVVHEFLDVAREEVIFRWILLGGLLLILPASWSLVVSSAVFASFHLVYPVYLGSPFHGYVSLLPTFAIGLFAGLAFIRYGLSASIVVHFCGNLIRVFAHDPQLDFLVDWILWGSTFVALIVLPLTLWFTRKRFPLTPARR